MPHDDGCAASMVSLGESRTFSFVLSSGAIGPLPSCGHHPRFFVGSVCTRMFMLVRTSMQLFLIGHVVHHGQMPFPQRLAVVDSGSEKVSVEWSCDGF